MPLSSITSSPESLAALEACIAAGLQLLTPPPELRVSDWSDRFMRLPREASPEPGPWSTERAPYQREMMDVVNDPGIETVVFMIASQCGKTAVELNIVGYFIHQDPSPILFVMPSEQLAENFSKERLAPMIRDTPVLTGLFGAAKTRESGNTLLNKQFPGGFIALAGSNAPRGLASRPVRILVMDEEDGFPASAGTEGDPVTLAEARTTNFWNRKRIYSSTPTKKGASRVEKHYQQSDQRVYEVPCPQCGTYQTLEWESLRWPSPNTGAKKHEPNRCYYVCVQGCEILEADKPDMLRQGKWRALNPGGGDGRTAGFQLSCLYSPWKTWPETISDWLKAYRLPHTRKAFWNTRLGRTYEVVGETVDDNALVRRRQLYPARVPDGVLVLTAGVDVQADRLEMEVVGWGMEEESWSVDYQILRGNPAEAEIWDRLDAALLDRYPNAAGIRLRIHSAFVDSGFHTKMVYRFCARRQVRRVFACKGQAGPGIPLTKPRASRVHRGPRVDLRIVGIDAAKEALYSNLKIDRIGPGYCHFPAAWTSPQGVSIDLPMYGPDYFSQLTAEKLVTEMREMTPVRKWEKKQERNEALDCRVYAMAALDDLNVNWHLLAQNMRQQEEQAKASTPEPVAEPGKTTLRKVLKQPKIPIRKGGYATSWKNKF